MAQDNHPRSNKGFISTWISRIMAMIVWLLLALLMSIITEWIGMNTSWRDEGVNHSRDMVKTELSYLNKDFQQSLLVQRPVEYAERIAAKMHNIMYVKTGIMGVLSNIFRDTTAGDVSRVIAEHVLAAVYVTQVFAIRLAILTLALPAFIIFAVVGSVEGLVQRDIRKWSVGREHASLYHHAKRWIPICFIAPWVVYLAFPISVHPNAVILPFALFFGVGIFMVTYLFKKYI
ncbi:MULTISPECIES: TIGR03747 family integrating conjugative element membrane protein [unclassified Methylophaga]|jgi:integrating conjugative element membrane protein (TIGR03747 family)|uniref:TIGR03747 family integrating conjugative element membrane protein n=1 Tax=unclassified Methylophaga TaxID=2629249 RepID=UPI000C451A93|nr:MULTISPECIES: TIGR03747 family integrating conjugative element membrane protein [unclassified Methylophaga]MAL50925.1 TIGR03747 family integrating conjugative element membrane protein [Methylophaga sp.]MBP26145.1 TIGR03747 family integrating conjugative element membrane protein [Methylophaga sp.]HCC79987.1 TIGR03747 family integrating conjugative element membrane protein [Methylophaga sp.]|tara:strand:+ start:8414 stop:9109 length:696 start_codon:yes stop_codon:yes gene_type:complete